MEGKKASSESTDIDDSNLDIIMAPFQSQTETEREFQSQISALTNQMHEMARMYEERISRVERAYDEAKGKHQDEKQYLVSEIYRLKNEVICHKQEKGLDEVRKESLLNKLVSLKIEMSKLEGMDLDPELVRSSLNKSLGKKSIEELQRRIACMESTMDTLQNEVINDGCATQYLPVYKETYASVIPELSQSFSAKDFKSRMREGDTKFRQQKRNSLMLEKKRVRGMSLTADCRNLFSGKDSKGIRASEVTFDDLLVAIYMEKPTHVLDSRINVGIAKKKDVFPDFDGFSRIELKNYLRKFHFHAIEFYGNSEDRWTNELKGKLEKHRLGKFIENTSIINMSYLVFIEMLIECVEVHSSRNCDDPKAQFADAVLQEGESISSFGVRLKTLYKALPNVSDIEEDPILVKHFFSSIPREFRNTIERKCKYAKSINKSEVDYTQVLLFSGDVEAEFGKEKTDYICRNFRRSQHESGTPTKSRHEWRERSPRRGSNSSDEGKSKFASQNMSFKKKGSPNRYSDSNYCSRENNNNKSYEHKKIRPWEERKHLFCQGCLRNGHKLEHCYFKEAVCGTCKKNGHFSSYCIEYHRKEQAIYILDNEIKERDFWIVDCDDNIYILQSVLDVLYNYNYPDYRIYLVDYMQYQSSTRLIIKCQVCSRNVISYDPFMSHDKGKQHIKAVVQTFTQDHMTPNFSCPITYKSQDSPVYNFEPDSLEYQLCQTNHPVLGSQFMYQEIYQDKEIFFTCQLCKAWRLRKQEAFNHITSDKHILRFLNLKYSLQHSTFEDAFEDIEKISVLEGRISAPFLTDHCSNIDRAFKIKPEIPPSVTQSDSEPFVGQIDSLMGSTESFVTQLPKLQNHFNNCDIMTLKLKDDNEAIQLETDLTQIIAKKLYDYSKIDNDYMVHAEKLYKKTAELTWPLD